MVRVKISSVLNLAESDFADKMQSVSNLLVASSFFVNPQPPVTAINPAITQLKQLIVDSETGDRTVIAEKRTALGTLQGLFRQLCMWIDFSVANAPNAEELINSIGLEVARSGNGHPVPNIPVPSDVNSEVSKEPGCVDILWSCERRGVHSFQIEIADTADVENATWRILATCTTAKFTASGLQRGKFYSFRIRCVAAKSAYGVVSETTTCMAG